VRGIPVEGLALLRMTKKTFLQAFRLPEVAPVALCKNDGNDLLRSRAGSVEGSVQLQWREKQAELIPRQARDDRPFLGSGIVAAGAGKFSFANKCVPKLLRRAVNLGTRGRLIASCRLRRPGQQVARATQPANPMI